MLDFQSLEEALSSVEKVGKGELTFEVSGIPMTLQVIEPDDQIEVQRYAAQVFEDKTDENGDTDQATSLEFLATFQVAIISHALIALNGHDFRDEPLVETGEVLPNGKAVTIPRYLALRQLIRKKWSRELRVAVFRKYGELVDIVEKEAEKAIEFTPTDYDAEIKRYEEMISTLQERKSQANSELRDSLGVKSILEMEMGTNPPTQASTPTEESEEPQVAVREPFFPPSVPPPQGGQPPQEPELAYPDDPGGSFFDPNDEDALQEANRRMAEARLRVQKGQAPQAPPSAINAIHSGQIPNPSRNRVPPHAVAAEVGQEFDHSQLDTQVSAQRVGQINGVEVYRPGGPQLIQEMPPQARQVPFEAPRSSTNPNFRSPKK